MLIVAAMTTVAVQLAAALLGRWVDALALGDLALPLAAAMIGFQTQDWLRRALFTRNAHRAVFASDMVAYCGQLLLLGFMAWAGRLGPAQALWVLGGVFTLSATLTTLAGRLLPSLATTLTVIRSHWRASRDFLTSWQLQWIGSSGVILVGTAFVGVQAAGAIRAAQNLLGPVNVLFQWMDNVVPVRCVRWFKEGGVDALAIHLRWLNVVGVLVLSVLVLAMYGAHDWLMTALYGPEFQPFAVLIVFQAVYYLFGHSYRMQAYFNRTLGNTGLLAKASLWWALAALVAALTLVNTLAERGIMAALVFGEVVAVAYLLLVSRKTALAAARTRSSHARLVLPNTATLVLPLANGRVMRGTLKMYYPSRWQGRLYRATLSTVAPLLARLGVLSGRAPSGWDSHFGTLLAAIPEARPEWTGGLQAAEGPRAKLTLRIMGEGGGALAYARVATGEVARRVVRNEAKMLATLRDTVLGEQIPQLISHGCLLEPDGYYLLESAGPDAPLSGDLGVRHFDFLAGLLKTGRSQTLQEALKQIERECRTLLEVTTHAEVVQEGIRRLLAAPARTMSVCIEHGDFAPWNLRQLPDGRPFAIDWEHGRQCGLPWLDALHFRFQMSAMVQRRSPRQALLTLLQTFDLPAARNYDKLAGIGGEPSRVLAGAYLLRALAAGHAEGRGPDAADQQYRVAVMKELLALDASNGD
jgi:O-antigen/teichoic acid export membrane protein